MWGGDVCFKGGVSQPAVLLLTSLQFGFPVAFGVTLLELNACRAVRAPKETESHICGVQLCGRQK